MPANTIVFKAITWPSLAARTPVLYQAGSSGRGWPSPRAMRMRVRFQPTKEGLRKLVSELRAAVAREGRDPRDIKFFMGITAVVGRTERKPGTSTPSTCATPARGWPGALRQLHRHRFFHLRAGRADPLREEQRHRIRRAQPDRARTDRTVRDLLADMALGGRYPALVGSAAQVADELESWVAETGIDGFNLARTVTPECYEDFIDLVIPELQSRGSYKTAYADGTLREAVRRGPAALPDVHAGARAGRHA